MCKLILSKKTHDKRSDYKQCRMPCKICEVVVKQKKSKLFSSPFALRYHLNREHAKEDEIIAGITITEINCVLEGVIQALEWNMLADIPMKVPRI